MRNNMWTSQSPKREQTFVSVRLRPLTEEEQASEVEVAWDYTETQVLPRKNCEQEKWDSESDDPWDYLDWQYNDELFDHVKKAYLFGRVFGPTQPTEEVYCKGAKNIVLSVLDGINATVFVYGQTGSGKTFTMRGIAESAFKDIFEHIQNKPERDYVLKLSVFEIYNETIVDLLNLETGSLPDVDHPKHEGIAEENLVEVAVKGPLHLQSLMGICEVQRQLTGTSDRSSRSSQIIRLTVESHPRQRCDYEESYIASLNLVDLAGGELAEGSDADRSMLILRQVMRAARRELTSAYAPINESKLTKVLGHSLTGNTRTAIICTMGPALNDVEQSRKTLSFARDAGDVPKLYEVNTLDDVARVEATLQSPEHASSYPHLESPSMVKKIGIQQHNDVARVETKLQPFEKASSFSLLESHLVSKKMTIRQMKKKLKRVNRKKKLLESQLKRAMQKELKGAKSSEPDRLVLKGLPPSRGTKLIFA